MNILLIGSGGREHAFSYYLNKSKLCSHLYIMPGNAGTAECGANVSINPLHFDKVAEFCIEKNIELILVGPEEPLVKGMRNYFESNEEIKHIKFVGPDQAGAAMEGSKDWSKAFMSKYNVPTATYKTFTAENLQEGLAYVKQHSLPIVLKADGLAAGKGVLICQTHAEAEAELEQMISQSKFGDASKKVVVEAFLDGIELSVFVLCDGNSYKILPSAKDYKRIGEGDTGLNTGGMGAISPVPFADEQFMEKVESRIIKPTIEGLKQEGIKYVGFIFIGLMKVGDEPWVIEYNSRMGDPETEAVLPRIKTDIGELMLASAEGRLHEMQLEISNQTAATVMLVSAGYPGDYAKGKVMTGFDDVNKSLVFHAGTKINANNEVETNGGRVLAITSLADNIKEAVALSMKAAAKINYDGKYFRKDIGYEFI
ncbi:MAG: phosphoribosylamine--glycine ligase [Bacteroidetes bacterium]|nr:phosphoribosylamine--glycine ligase [Bacteroidota bacterium]